MWSAYSFRGHCWNWRLLIPTKQTNIWPNDRPSLCIYSAILQTFHIFILSGPNFRRQNGSIKYSIICSGGSRPSVFRSYALGRTVSEKMGLTGIMGRLAKQNKNFQLLIMRTYVCHTRYQSGFNCLFYCVSTGQQSRYQGLHLPLPPRRSQNSYKAFFFLHKWRLVSSSQPRLLEKN